MTLQELFVITFRHGYFLQILMAELLFLPVLRYRERLIARLIVGIPVCCVLAVIIPNLMAHFVEGLYSLCIFLCTVGLFAFLFENQFSQLLYCCVGAQLIQNLSYNIETLIYSLVQNFFSASDFRWFCLSVSVMAVVYVICSRLFVERLTKQSSRSLNGYFVYGMSIVIALFAYFMQFLFQSYGLDHLWVTRPPIILCDVFGLCVQFGFLALSNEMAENEMLQHLVENEHRQYEITRDSMDAINRKAHDLKHQIARIRAINDMDQEEFAEIESAVTEYESCFQTGNRTLDVILTEKKLICQRDRIEFSVIAQGEALNFLRPGEIASLFGNALDNAIECEEKVPEQDAAKRCIALNVFERRSLLCIRIENYCTELLHIDSGFPVTTKQDRTSHGFGLRSIQYITEKYGGTMKVGTEQNLFVLTLLLPAGNEDKSACDP